MKGAEIPLPFGGKYRQIDGLCGSLKLMSRQLSLTDVVNGLNNSNLILPSGDVKIGPYDYYVYSNSLVERCSDLNNIPIKTVGDFWVRISRRGEGRGREPDSVQHRARGRPEVELYSRS